MVTHAEPEIILYDLACIKKICFSPAVWRIRLMLNYKKIPYRTIFLEFPDIEPTLTKLGLDPGTAPSGARNKFTLPTIHHLPTNIHLMDSHPIAHFLESTYPDPPIPLTSPLGTEIELQARAVIGKVFRTCILPREIHILSPRAQEYFRRTREADLGGKRLEELLGEGEEERSWEAAGKGMRGVGELLRTNRAEGPFAARVVDEGVFGRVVVLPGFRDVYEACLPYMERKD
ncbi:hypothetical protein B0A55_03137 [Friedmanniomyces simplex]|uniref:Uncharacterized protein n=1 Tax=Friedmanniomyces simplex TaxID=329884 RepID=A0A4U0XK72_9PEZI|nr:hypothetical protein B0A55_03137 [Friedmanniomyces simplex]